MVSLAYFDINLNGNVVPYKKIEIYNRPFLLLSILIYTIIIGCRYDVGIDWLGYKTTLEELIRTGAPDRDIEYGYFLIMKIVDILRLHYVFLFIFIAFLQIGFIYLRAKDFNKVFPFLLIFFFTMGNFIYCLNIMRQMIAFSIIFYGTKFIVNKNIKAWLIICILAILFHKTAILCLPFYFFNKNFFKNRLILVLVLVSIYLLFKYFIAEKTDVLLGISNILFNRETSIESLYSQNREGMIHDGSGLFDLAEVFFYSIMLYHYHESGKCYKKKGFYLFFNLTSIGIILFPLVSFNILLDRIIYYFGAFKFVTFGFYAHYFIFVRKNIYLNIIGIFIIIAYFLTFLMAIYNCSNQCSPFQFIGSDR